MDIVVVSDRGSRPGRGAQKTITNTTTPGATRRDIHVDTKTSSKLTQISMQSATHEHEGRMTICRDELLQMTPSSITRLSRIKVISVRDPKVSVTLSRRSFLTRAAVITWRSPYQRHVKHRSHHTRQPIRDGALKSGRTGQAPHISVASNRRLRLQSATSEHTHRGPRAP